MFNLCFSGAKVEGMNFITVAGIFLLLTKQDAGMVI